MAVVSISTALLPYPNSVNPKHPTSSKVSMPFNNLEWCLSVPSFKTVPPNKLNWKKLQKIKGFEYAFNLLYLNS